MIERERINEMALYKDNTWVWEQNAKIYNENGFTSMEKFEKRCTVTMHNERRLSEHSLDYDYQYWFDGKPVHYWKGDDIGFGLMPGRHKSMKSGSRKR